VIGNNTKLVKELMEYAGNFSTLYRALVEERNETRTSSLNKEKVIARIQKIKDEDNHSWVQDNIIPKIF